MWRQPGFSRKPSSLRVLEHSAAGIQREGERLLELLGFHLFPFSISIIFCMWTKALDHFSCQLIRKGLCMSDGGGLQNKSRKKGRGMWACTRLQKPWLVSLWVTRIQRCGLNLKTAVVLAKERTPGLTPGVPLKQLHQLAGVKHLQSDIKPIMSTLCPSVSQNQRALETRG